MRKVGLEVRKRNGRCVMNDRDKTKEQLIEENAGLRGQIAALEAQLAQSQQVEADQRQFNDGLPVLVATAGSDGYCKEVNAAFERILGWSEQESLSRPFLDFIHPEDRAMAVETLARLKSGDPAINFLDRNICKDGSYRWISWTVIPVPGRDILFGIGQDITERKQAEQALRESEECFQAFMDNSPSAAWMKDEQGHYVYLNKAYEKLLGVRREDRLGKTDFDLWPAETAEQFWKNDQTVLAGDQAVGMTEECVDAKGERCYWWSFKFPFQDAQGKRYIGGVAADITDRRRAEDALQKAHDELERRVEERTAELQASRERFELVVRGVGVGIWDWDVRTGKVYYSRRWRMLFGYEENEIGDEYDDQVRLLHPDERDRIIKLREDFLAGTSSNITAEYRLRHKDGSYRWLVGHGVVVRDEQGKAIRLVGSHGDVTDRKLAEEKLKAEQQALRRMMLASDHERRLITYELHDGVAQQIVGAKMLFESQQPPKGGKSKAAGVYRDGMAALTQASLEIRRVMNWLRTPVLDKSGLVEAIEDVASQLRLRPDAPEIECRLDVKFKRLEPTLENTLFRIAQEAMTNACRHSQSEKLHVKLTQKGDNVALEVRDWGIGFDQDKVHENRFGLEGIRERARILGGKLSIKSSPGEGTVVRAKFPVIEAVDEE